MMGPMIGPAPPPLPFAESLREQFFRLGVPLTIQPAPGGGALALGEFGEQFHFSSQADVDFFLLGFRLGQQTAQPAPIRTPTDAEYAGYQRETGG